MKVWICYVIWNKAAHVPWICEGIRDCFPQGTVVDFILDNCTDQTEANLNLMVTGILSGFDVRISKGRKYRWTNTNDSMERFTKSDCDVFFSPQDDQKIQDKKLYGNVKTLLEKYGRGVFMGFRDGVDFDGKYYSSNFSKGYDYTTWLSSGESKLVRYVNDGPILLTKPVIQYVGFFNEDFIAHYVDNDYSFRVNRHGMACYVMGAEVVHEKWECKICGPLIPSDVWTQEVSDHDYKLYRQLWPT